jgi:hypothetical protein
MPFQLCKFSSSYFWIETVLPKIRRNINVVPWILSTEFYHFSSMGCTLSWGLSWWPLAEAMRECRQIYAGWPSWLNVLWSFVISTGVTDRTFHWQSQWVFYLSGIFRAHLYASENLSLAQGCFPKRHTTRWIFQRIEFICILVH